MFLVSSCSCLCPIQWNQVLSRDWRCSWSSAGRRCSSYIWMINKCIAYLAAIYIRCLTVRIDSEHRIRLHIQRNGVLSFQSKHRIRLQTHKCLKQRKKVIINYVPVDGSESPPEMIIIFYIYIKHVLLQHSYNCIKWSHTQHYSQTTGIMSISCLIRWYVWKYDI